LASKPYTAPARPCRPDQSANLTADETKRLRALEQENSRLKKLVAIAISRSRR